MLISRANLAVLHAASDDEKQPALNRVHLESDGTTVAGNGRMLMAVSPVPDELAEKFPMVGEESADIPRGGVGLRLDLVADAVKGMPRDRRTSIQQAQLTRCDDEVVELMTTNGAKKRKSAGMPMRGKFPKWRGEWIKAKKKACVGRICFNGREMINTLTALLKACPDKGNFNPVFMQFGEETDGIVMRGMNYETGQAAVAMVNPLDTKGQWMRESEWEKGLVGKKVRRVDR